MIIWCTLSALNTRRTLCAFGALTCGALSVHTCYPWCTFGALDELLVHLGHFVRLVHFQCTRCIWCTLGAFGALLVQSVHPWCTLGAFCELSIHSMILVPSVHFRIHDHLVHSTLGAPSVHSVHLPVVHSQCTLDALGTLGALLVHAMNSRCIWCTWGILCIWCTLSTLGAFGALLVQSVQPWCTLGVFCELSVHLMILVPSVHFLWSTRCTLGALGSLSVHSVHSRCTFGALALHSVNFGCTRCTLG